MPGRGHRRAGPRLRPGRPRPAVLDARHHRAPQRRRQRARAHQPGAAVRPRRPLRLRAQPAAGPEQRPGRRRHGRHPQQAARASRTSSTTRPRPKFDAAWGSHIPPRHGLHLSDMFEAMERGELTALYVIGENPAQSEAESEHAVHLLEGLDHLVVQDIFLTRTAQLAYVVLPASRGVVRDRGHGDQQRAPGAAGAQGARAARAAPATTSRSSSTIARRLGHDWHVRRRPRPCGTSCAALSPMHAGHVATAGSRSWAASSGPAPTRTAWSRRGCTAGCGPRTRPSGAARRRSRSWCDEPPVDELDDEFPLRLTTGRRLDSYNTGVQSGGFASPLRFGETIDLSPGGRRAARPSRTASRSGSSSRRGTLDGPGPRSTPRCGRAWSS